MSLYVVSCWLACPHSTTLQQAIAVPEPAVPCCSLLPPAAPCCRHILGGVEYSLELCTASSGLGLGGSLLKLGFGTVTKANSKEMASTFVNERIRKALAAAHVSSHVMTALQASRRQLLDWATTKMGFLALEC